MRKKLVWLLLLCFVTVCALPLQRGYAAENIAFLEDEIKENMRHYTAKTSDQARMEAFIRQWQTDRYVLGQAAQDLESLSKKMTQLIRDNAVKSMATLGFAAAGAMKDAAELGAAIASGGVTLIVKWAAEQAVEELTGQAAEFGGQSYYTVKIKPFHDEAVKSMPQIIEIRKLLISDLPNIQQLIAQTDGNNAGELQAVYAQLRLVFEKCRQTQPVIFAQIRAGDAVQRDFEAKITELQPEIERLKTRLLELNDRLQKARQQERADKAETVAKSLKADPQPKITLSPPSSVTEWEAAAEQTRKAEALIAAQYPPLRDELQALDKEYKALYDQSVTNIHHPRLPSTPDVLRSEAEVTSQLAQMSLENLAGSYFGSQELLPILTEAEPKYKKATEDFGKAADVAKRTLSVLLKLVPLYELNAQYQWP